MLQVTIPRRLFNETLYLVEIGIVQNMTTHNTRFQNAQQDEVFEFNTEDENLVRRVLSRMFGMTESQITYTIY